MRFKISSILAFVFLMAMGQSAWGQEGQYNFNDCTYADQNGSYDDATTIFDPSCECGLVDSGLYFDGQDDHLFFPSNIDSLMEEDFTISFYFRFDQVTGRTDLLSVRSECALDSFLAISYNPTNNQIAFELAQNIGNIVTENVPLDESLCWHRLVLTKSELFYNLYLDDQLAASILSDGLVNFDDQARLTFSNSPCILLNLNRFNGWMDEFQFYERALSAIEIVNSSLNPDQVLTSDTTIVAGSPVDIEVGPTCATDFTWAPTADLDDPSILNPTATPEATTTYSITFDNEGTCSTTDEVTINVIDPEAIDCSLLLLPNAFTPNGDQLNDQFGISTLFLVDELAYFEVYDRWGGKMWSTTNKNNTWDGTFSGSLVNPGMYIYKVKYTCGGEEFLKVDNFSVIR